MSKFRKTGIFPFDPEAVKIKPPTLELPATKTTKLQSRKERKDSRSIKVLFQDKVTAFNESAVAKDQPPKTKRKTFVPPFGAAITEAKYRELIMEKETTKQSIATLAQPSTSSNSQLLH